MLGCHCTCWRGHGVVHVWRQFTPWTWHGTPYDLLEYHTTCQCCMSLGVLALAHVILLTRAEVDTEEDTRQHIIWLDKMLHDIAVSAVCRWARSPLNMMLSRAVSVDLLEAKLHSAHRYFASVWRCYHVFCVVESTGKDKWPYNFGHALTDLVTQWAFDDVVRWMRPRELWVVALAGRTRTCFICAVHRWTCWKDMRCCTTKVKSLSSTLSPCICNGAVAVSTTLVCDRFVKAFHLSVAMSILSSRDLLLMQIQRIGSFTHAFLPVENVDSCVKMHWKKKQSTMMLLLSRPPEACDQYCSSKASDA